MNVPVVIVSFACTDLNLMPFDDSKFYTLGCYAFPKWILWVMKDPDRLKLSVGMI